MEWLAIKTGKLMTHRQSIPQNAIYRMSIYLRCLERLQENAVESVSSETLAKIAGVTPTQLRKDLTYFGHFGVRGLGYNVAALTRAIREALGTSRLQPVILVGAGNLGSALLAYRGFAQAGFEIVAGFDVVGGHRHARRFKQPVMAMERLSHFVRSRRIKIAILAVPSTVAQEVTNKLVAAGIAGILNFSAIMLQVPEHVSVNNVNLANELENLSYFIKS